MPELKKSQEIAQQLFKNMDTQSVAKITRLSLEDNQDLKNEEK